MDHLFLAHCGEFGWKKCSELFGSVISPLRFIQSYIEDKLVKLRKRDVTFFYLECIFFMKSDDYLNRESREMCWEEEIYPNLNEILIAADRGSSNERGFRL
jgi:hypothetical protein